jgi:hypothetical protein
MSSRQEPWPQGTPNWVDLSSPDPAASNAFYGSLFGWEIQDSGPEMGNYGMCLLGGRPVAGIGPQLGGDAPPAWLTYLAVEDVEKVAEAVPPHGGTLVVPPMSVGDAGRMAVAQDPTGAFVGLWQAGGTIGLERFNEPGTVVWNEHLSHDTQRARDFYAGVFGHGFAAVEGMEYWMISLPGSEASVGGLGTPPVGEPDHQPPHWRTYFEVTSADESAARSEELGGTVAQGPIDTPYGRIAVVADPHGAIFSLLQAPSQG